MATPPTNPTAAPPNPGEELLAALASDDSIQNALNRMVERLTAQWEARWCLLYLFDEASQRLTLQAAAGNPELQPGAHAVALGEGLAGSVLERRKPLYTERASAEATYREDPRFPIREAETLLAIPVLRGEERIGVLLLHRPTGVSFTPGDISTLRTTVSQLAGFLENARALLLIAARVHHSRCNGTLEVPEQRLFRGTPVTRGVAIGATRVLARERAAQTLEACRRGASPPPARRTLDEAVELAARQLQQDQEALGRRLPEAAAMLFEAHLMMLKDDSFIGKIRERIRDGRPPVQAIAATAVEFIAFFESSRHDYLREKARDVEDLALRLLANIQSEPAAEGPAEEAHVLLTAELLPSDILRVAQGNVQGIVLVGGGSTAHVTLLVRSLRIPMVMTQADELLRVRDGVPTIVDCASGNIILRPNEALAATYAERRRQAGIQLHEPVRPETFTKDGCRVRLYANINLLAELDLANSMQAEGVGLYRTEFPFLMRQALPTEDEQLAVYGRVLEQMRGKPVIFRTLDAGGDKVLSYFDQAREENPALGLRSTRFTLRYPFIFDQQLRAILRAIRQHQHQGVKVMFPMIGSVEELRAAMDRVEVCLEQLRQTPSPLPLIRPEIGSMVELPALVHLADAIAREAAFLSIGTNDFIQYMLAVDRTNAQVAHYYVPHHPAVLQGLRHVVQAALAAGREISVCGEMGRDPRYIPFFLGLGVRLFSVEPGYLGMTQRVVGQIALPEAEAYAQDLLGTNHIARIEEAVERMRQRLVLGA